MPSPSSDHDQPTHFAPCLLILDGTNMGMRDVKGAKDPRRFDPTTQYPVDGVYNTLNRMGVNLDRLLHKAGLPTPDAMVAFFDSPGVPKQRKTWYPDYKSQREDRTPQEQSQLDLIQEGLGHLGIHVHPVTQDEADDAIHAMAQSAYSRGYDVIIATTDKDFASAVTARSLPSPDAPAGLARGISVVNLFDVDKKPREAVWASKDDVFQKFGVLPEHMTLFLALSGDAADNVKNVPGIGDAIARKLVKLCDGSLDTLQEQLLGDQYKIHLAEYKNAGIRASVLVPLINALKTPGEDDPGATGSLVLAWRLIQPVPYPLSKSGITPHKLWRREPKDGFSAMIQWCRRHGLGDLADRDDKLLATYDAWPKIESEMRLRDAARMKAQEALRESANKITPQPTPRSKGP